jgi:hypothetical protein
MTHARITVMLPLVGALGFAFSLSSAVQPE